MATLEAIRAGLGEVLASIPGLVVSKNLPSIQNLGDGGGAVVGAPTGDLTNTMARGNVTWNFPIYLLAPAANMDRATEILDELCTPFGPRSVPGAIWEQGRAPAGGLGVLDSNSLVDADAHISEVTANGVEFPNAGIEHIGAVLNCVVHTPGRPT
jgi:hypothetical protein